MCISGLYFRHIGTNYCSSLCCKCVPDVYLFQYNPKCKPLFSPGLEIPLLVHVSMYFKQRVIPLPLFTVLCIYKSYRCCNYPVTTTLISTRSTTAVAFIARLPLDVTIISVESAHFLLTGLDFLFQRCTSAPVQDVSLPFAKCMQG